MNIKDYYNSLNDTNQLKYIIENNKYWYFYYIFNLFNELNIKNEHLDIDINSFKRLINDIFDLYKNEYHSNENFEKIYDDNIQIINNDRNLFNVLYFYKEINKISLYNERIDSDDKYLLHFCFDCFYKNISYLKIFDFCIDLYLQDAELIKYKENMMKIIKIYVYNFMLDDNYFNVNDISHLIYGFKDIFNTFEKKKKLKVLYNNNQYREIVNKVQKIINNIILDLSFNFIILNLLEKEINNEYLPSLITLHINKEMFKNILLQYIYASDMKSNIYDYIKNNVKLNKTSFYEIIIKNIVSYEHLFNLSISTNITIVQYLKTDQIIKYINLFKKNINLSYTIQILKNNNIVNLINVNYNCNIYQKLDNTINIYNIKDMCSLIEKNKNILNNYNGIQILIKHLYIFFYNNVNNIKEINDITKIEKFIDENDILKDINESDYYKKNIINKTILMSEYDKLFDIYSNVRFYNNLLLDSNFTKIN